MSECPTPQRVPSFVFARQHVGRPDLTGRDPEIGRSASCSQSNRVVAFKETALKWHQQSTTLPPPPSYTHTNIKPNPNESGPTEHPEDYSHEKTLCNITVQTGGSLQIQPLDDRTTCVRIHGDVSFSVGARVSLHVLKLQKQLF